MNTDDKTIRRAIVELRFALEDLKEANKGDTAAERRKPLAAAALTRLRGVVAALEGGTEGTK